ncbi:arginine deiminase-related protein [Bradyrhizobium sp. SSUT77]|uniref:dimethylarginine dimethylaminohydrolase family protein n=1 Tax=Bradyrhizobium sp. SSUT77 TaxID=3040603 RepID=UPI0024476F27|nr:arginine deiminase-related protein [Bradyrhizobium sp. SSUT77]MDH2348178.1 arginine deiminase-related protein [Bradyrhizobium sp. SSUT77]
MAADHHPRFLMCPPNHFAVTYSINPWMDPEGWRERADTLAQTSEAEWRSLKSLLEQLGAIVDLMDPAAGAPDLVFTANAAVVLDGTALLARFRYLERRLEEPHFAAALKALIGRNVLKRCAFLPADIVLEGAGDCIWDPERNLFWMGFGPRSSKHAAAIIRETFGFPTLSMELIDSRFYHLDTAFSVLAEGEIMYFKEALSSSSLHKLYERVDIRDRIEVSEEDACTMHLNAIRIGRKLVLSSCSSRLRRQLADRGYSVSITSLSSFNLSGGSAYCLTLRTDLSSDSRLLASNIYSESDT